MSERKAVCVIGWPAGHSRSPLIHNYWIAQHGIDAEYRKEPVAPEQFAEFITHLRAHGYVGCNVTVPHKRVALELSQPDDRAKGVGAANTLGLDGDKLRSTNTDVEGFLANLDAATPGWDRGLDSAMVLDQLPSACQFCGAPSVGEGAPAVSIRSGVSIKALMFLPCQAAGRPNTLKVRPCLSTCSSDLPLSATGSVALAFSKSAACRAVEPRSGTCSTKLPSWGTHSCLHTSQEAESLISRLSASAPGAKPGLMVSGTGSSNWPS